MRAKRYKIAQKKRRTIKQRRLFCWRCPFVHISLSCWIFFTSAICLSHA